MTTGQPVDVTVRIPATEFSDGSVSTITVIKLLRNRGVPVLGKLLIRGVAHGELTMFCDGGDLVYRWVGIPDESESDLI